MKKDVVWYHFVVYDPENNISKLAKIVPSENKMAASVEKCLISIHIRQSFLSFKFLCENQLPLQLLIDFPSSQIFKILNKGNTNKNGYSSL